MLKKYYYITVLSNWLLGFDKYSKTYNKSMIKESTFSSQFYLLSEMCDESIGLDKGMKLLSKLGIKDDTLVKVYVDVEKLNHEIHPNTRNGRGYYINDVKIPVSSVEIFDIIHKKFIPSSCENATAQSYLLKNVNWYNYDELRPRTLSLLPIANACQAKCLFCFSDASISYDQEKYQILPQNLSMWCQKAKEKGAERFVITGGGEPGLLNFSTLCDIVKTAKKEFDKIVLITNGLFLRKSPKLHVEELQKAGLSVLCLSRHHSDNVRNSMIMGVDNHTDKILKAINSVNITKRLICVLQKQGVHDELSIKNYLNFAVEHGVDQICFKELYVSSTSESLYAGNTSNQYCEKNQISLSIVLDFCHKYGFNKVTELPWGSPVFEGEWNGKRVGIAAYTEPSVGWERKHGIARSWNILSDEKCYASLEDIDSEIKE